jgi:3-phosphoshikimate 1-carboxyvinyltransferase
MKATFSFPDKPITASIAIPGDKSISHRMVILASLSECTVTVKNLLLAEDVVCTINAFREMGVSIDVSENAVTIEGVGLHGLKKPNVPLYMGNSGTAARLMLGVLCGQDFEATLEGDSSLSKRPMSRVLKPLSQMGGVFESKDGCLPVTVRPANRLAGIEIMPEVVSAQVKSAILLAGLYADGETIVKESVVTRRYTENMLQSFGGIAEIVDSKVVIKQGAKKLQFPNTVEVPADISSAAFFIVLASIASSAEVKIKNIDTSVERAGLINVLTRMGADIQISNHEGNSGFNTSDLVVRSSKLSGAFVDNSDVPNMIDEIPILTIAAIAAEGDVEVTDAEELRVKESDRISSMVKGCEKLNLRLPENPDGFIVPEKSTIKPNTIPIESNHDHRIAMSFAIASVLLDGEIEIEGVESIQTSFPTFLDIFEKLGGQIKMD